MSRKNKRAQRERERQRQIHRQLYFANSQELPSGLVVIQGGKSYNHKKHKAEETQKIGSELFGGRYYCVGDN